MNEIQQNKGMLVVHVWKGEGGGVNRVLIMLALKLSDPPKSTAMYRSI